MATVRPMQILIIALLASYAAAAGSIESQLLGEGSALLRSTNLSYSQILLNGSTYYILFSNENPAAVFLQQGQVQGQVQGQEPQGQNISLLRTQGQIFPVLLSYYNISGAQAQALAALTRAHATILQFEAAAGGQGVRDCRRITGTDTHHCNTYENCRLACYSVTSYCYPIALGAGRSFIEEIWKFTNNTRDMSGAIANEKAAYADAISSPNTKTIATYLTAFNDASGIANELENSVLVNWICPSQGFDMVAMSKAGSSLSLASLSIESYEYLHAHADAMERFANKSMGAPPLLFALEPSARGTSSCLLRVEHFITSGNATSLVTISLKTMGGCNLSSFGLRERIPENFSAYVEKGRFSIPPVSLEGREAYWEFDSLQDKQVLVLTYSTDGWVGYSRVKHFNGTTISLLPAKPLLQNHGIIPIKPAIAKTNTGAATENKNNASAAALPNASGNSATSNNATSANASQNSANTNDANSKTAPAAAGQQPALPTAAEQNAAAPSIGGTLFLAGAGAIVLVALAAAAYLLFFKKGNKKGM